MSPFFYRCYRGAVLGLMLLLAGAANMVCFSYDADNDEDTPPITIEIHVVAPDSGQQAQKHVAGQGSRSATYHLSDVKPVMNLMASADMGAAPQFAAKSPQLVVPLRR